MLIERDDCENINHRTHSIELLVSFDEGDKNLFRSIMTPRRTSIDIS